MTSKKKLRKRVRRLERHVDAVAFNLERLRDDMMRLLPVHRGPVVDESGSEAHPGWPLKKSSATIPLGGE